ASFTSVSVAAGAGASLVSLTTSGSFTLQAGTSYWFLLDGPAVSNSLLWHDLSPNTAPTAASGITYNGYRFSSNGGGTWGSSSIFNGVELRAVPAPGALALVGLGGLAAARRRR